MSADERVNNRLHELSRKLLQRNRGLHEAKNLKGAQEALEYAELECLGQYPK